MLSPTHRMHSLLASAVFVLSFSLSPQANAALVSYTSDGADLVYSSISDVSWTKDAHLLSSMISNSGYSTVVDAILTANAGVTFGSTPYTLSNADFSNVGETSWWGAMAFVHYLNTINYAGSDAWRLPTVTDIGNDGCNWSLGGTDCGYNAATNGTAAGDEMAELYYKELNGQAYSGEHSQYHGINSPLFSNVQSFYWTGTELITDPNNAFIFFATYGDQSTYMKNSTVWYAWAVSPGSVIPVDVPTAVPEPETNALLLAGLGLILMFAVLRKRTT
ncbi:PEP-CTERM sorting domain-containing protein [Methylophilus sp. 5]|uniref:PEP-CTERM sorting domain-containing protein n=1 Tax=Methylophilus sp. 5 TaxID=1112274 RepID=UPI0009DF2540|nr:PEP-CTERM sorting domain-containing protein [Methylophilus sp. 5]